MMSPAQTRRRFLAIAATSAGLTALGLPASQAASDMLQRWSGRALGARVSMQLAIADRAKARRVFLSVERELARLERVFSLYDRNSELARLNAVGHLRAPSADMFNVIHLCDRLYHATNGAFDPTVQPLWMLFANATRHGIKVKPAQEHAVRQRIGWSKLRFDRQHIKLSEPDMALTLNGIAQGYITDRIAALLRQHELQNVLIDMGEIVASGGRPDGRVWTAGIALPDGRIVNRVELQDRALATSAPSGTILYPRLKTGHILDARATARSRPHELVSVSSGSAAIADGLSTAGCLMSHPELDLAIGSFPETKLESRI